MKAKKDNLMTLEEFKTKHYGKRGAAKREELEAGFESFRIGALLHEARLEKGMTQEELAEKVGTTKSYISKIENNIPSCASLSFRTRAHQGTAADFTARP